MGLIFLFSKTYQQSIKHINKASNAYLYQLDVYFLLRSNPGGIDPSWKDGPASSGAPASSGSGDGSGSGQPSDGKQTKPKTKPKPKPDPSKPPKTKTPQQEAKSVLGFKFSVFLLKLNGCDLCS